MGLARVRLVDQRERGFIRGFNRFTRGAHRVEFGCDQRGDLFGLAMVICRASPADMTSDDSTAVCWTDGLLVLSMAKLPWVAAEVVDLVRPGVLRSAQIL